jgi:hypothetical protein
LTPLHNTAPQAPAKYMHLAVAALVVASLSLAVAFVPIVGLVSIVGALVAVVLGAVAVGLGNPRKTKILGFVAMVLSLPIWFVVGDANEDAFGSFGQDDISTTGSSTNATTPAAGQPAPIPTIPTWGQTYTWTATKIAIQVEAPTPCTPSSTAALNGKPRAMALKVTITNGGDKPFETATLSLGTDAQFAGAKAATVLDFGGDDCTDGSLNATTVLPGNTYSYTIVHSVGNGTGPLQVSFRSTLLSDNATFVGPVPA